MVLIDDKEVASYTVREDSHALVAVEDSIKLENNSHSHTNERDRLATSSMGYHNSQGHGRTGLTEELDSNNDVASIFPVNHNVNSVELASNYLGWRDELCYSCHFEISVALKMASFN